MPYSGFVHHGSMNLPPTEWQRVVLRRMRARWQAEEAATELDDEPIRVQATVGQAIPELTSDA